MISRVYFGVLVILLYLFPLYLTVDIDAFDTYIAEYDAFAATLA